jgi:hypothetical protein
MFVVPGAIVSVVVILGLVCSGAFNYFLGFGHARTPEAFIKRLEDPNTDVRWRAANDLVQVLKRDDELASDPALGLKLAELLGRELEQIVEDEQTLLKRSARMSKEERLKEQNQLKMRRDYIRFLSACLASMMIPVGVDPLKEMAQIKGTDVKAVALLRRHAVWMLANLGENLKRFEGSEARGYPGLPAPRRQLVLARLQEEAQTGLGQRRQLAAATLDALEGKRDLGVIAALAECAKADDPDLRKYVAYALTFWDGSPNENDLAEKTLLMLSRDDGRGVRVILSDDD